MPDQTQVSPQAVARRLLPHCATALAVLALLAVVGAALTQWDLKRHADDARIISIAGRQCLLSQELAKAALAIRYSDDPGARALRVTELQTVADLWERRQRGLQHGDTGLGLSGVPPPKIQAMYAQIEPQHELMLAAAHILLASASQEAASQTSDPSWSPCTQVILQQETSFLPGMDAIVTEYGQQADARDAMFKQAGLAMLGLSLLVMLLEGIFIFRPAIGRILTAMAGMQEAEERAARQKAILLERNTQLEEQRQELLARQAQLLEADACIRRTNTELEQATRLFEEWSRKFAVLP